MDFTPKPLKPILPPLEPIGLDNRYGNDPTQPLDPYDYLEPQQHEPFPEPLPSSLELSLDPELEEPKFRFNSRHDDLQCRRNPIRRIGDKPYTGPMTRKTDRPLFKRNDDLLGTTEDFKDDKYDNPLLPKPPLIDFDLEPPLKPWEDPRYNR